MPGDTRAAPAHSSTVLETLLEQHRVFLRYLTRRLGDPVLAEDLLQEAFAKVVARPGLAPEDENLIPWFYRALGNAAIDQFRRRGAAARALEAFGHELTRQETAETDARAEICACISRLATTLKPEYAEALEAIEIQDMPVSEFARARRLTPGNAAVRIHRARRALKKRVTEACGVCAEHGCRDCTCRPAPTEP